MPIDWAEMNVSSRSAHAKEPKVRKDGRCLVCGKLRPEVAVGYQDPFCSTLCCRTYYRVRDMMVSGTGA